MQLLCHQKNLFSVDIITKRYIENFILVKEMELKNHKICSKTVMDTSDPNITFNKEKLSQIIILIIKKILLHLGKMMVQISMSLLRLLIKLRWKEKIMNLIV